LAHEKDLKGNIFLLMLAIVSLLLFGTIIFHNLEGWSFLDSFYFVSMTATTVGYGDFHPTHALSKIITVFYSLTIVPFILYGFTIIAKYEVERVYRQIHGIEKKQKEQESELEKTERKLEINKRLLKEQQELLDKQTRDLKKQKMTSELQGQELEGHQKKIKKAEKELKEHGEELEVVEDIVEDQIAKELKAK